MNALAEKNRPDGAPEVKRGPGRPRGSGPKIAGGTGDSRKIAAAILEVLAGVRTPSEICEALGIAMPRYYQLESRALEGLVHACEPRPKGRQRGPESQVSHLEQELERARRENNRLSALVRVARRAAGVNETPPRKAEPGRKRRKRKAAPRALRAIAVLRAQPESQASSAVPAASP